MVGRGGGGVCTPLTKLPLKWNYSAIAITCHHRLCGYLVKFEKLISYSALSLSTPVVLNPGSLALSLFRSLF